MFKRQRDITPPTSDDEEPRRRLVDYSDTESSDDEDNIRPPPRKRRPMVIYSDTESSDDEDDEDLTSYITLLRQSTRRSLDYFELRGKNFSSTSRLSLTLFRTYSSYQDYLIGW